MPDVRMGKRVNDLVRNYFKLGKKSSNKLYATTDLEGKNVPDTEKARKREMAQYDAQFYITHIHNCLKGKSFDGMAYELLDPELVKANVLSGNCGEMSLVAEYLVRHDEHYPIDQIYHCAIGAPGDHSFCLVSDSTIAERDRYSRNLYWFLRQKTQHLIIDPWLNTACLTRDYGRLVEEKLEKWTASGKRIHWNGPDGKNPGWYPPGGAYKIAMQRSPIKLIPYG